MTDKTVKQPKPSSPEATAAGCRCPIIDNHHGKGADLTGTNFWISTDCPLHGVCDD